MFGLFKNSVIKPSNDVMKFLENLIKILPKEYIYLLDQINTNFFLGLEKSKINQRRYTFVLNANLQQKYENKKVANYFILENILVWENTVKEFLPINISIVKGLMISLELESTRFGNYDFLKYNISKMSKKRFNNEDKKELFQIIGRVSKENQEKLDIEDTFKIEIPEGVFYTIKNIGDGDYLAVNINGEVYELLHDPYAVRKKASNIHELLQ